MGWGKPVELGGGRGEETRKQGPKTEANGSDRSNTHKEAVAATWFETPWSSIAAFHAAHACTLRRDCNGG